MTVLIWGCIMAGTSVTAAPQGQPIPLTPHRVLALRWVESAVLSPDGTQVACTLSVPRTPMRDEDGPSWSELHVVPFEGGASRPFVTGEVNVSAVRWTPDSRRIAFLMKRGKDEFTSLYAIAVDGGEARRIAALKSDIAGYSFAKDGARVAVIATEPETDERKKAREKGFKQEVYEEDWRAKRVYVVDLEHAESEPRLLAIDGSVAQVQWSPVDDRLAVAVAPTALVDDGYMRQRVRVVDAKSGAVLARIENPGKLGDVSWSPDGERLAIVCGGDLNDPAAARLAVVLAGGSALGWILPDAAGDFLAVGWRDASTLAYAMAQGVWTAIETIAADGSGRASRIAPGGAIVSALSIARDGARMVLVANTPAHPGEAFALGPDDSQPRRLTESNPWLRDAPLARQEPIAFQARDGLELEGVLVHPLDGRAPAPLILTVHGGPEAHVGNGWVTSYSNPGQTAAARGFAVFYPNYRGGTGRGIAFAKLSQGDPAGREFDDLIDAVDALAARGLIDRHHVGVTGASYGGYATAWCATRFSERFGAGVMMVGISNKISKVGTTDIPDEEYHVHARKRPWDDWTFFLERSPVYHAEGSRTPLLILHGKDDPRVSVTQSRELYRRLKIGAQAPVRLVLYPGEEHGNRRAAAKLDYSLRMLQWMEHYLKGPGGAAPPYEIDHGEPGAKSGSEGS